MRGFFSCSVSMLLVTNCIHGLKNERCSVYRLSCENQDWFLFFDEIWKQNGEGFLFRIQFVYNLFFSFVNIEISCACWSKNEQLLKNNMYLCTKIKFHAYN